MRIELFSFVKRLLGIEIKQPPPAVSPETAKFLNLIRAMEAHVLTNPNTSLAEFVLGQGTAMKEYIYSETHEARGTEAVEKWLDEPSTATAEIGLEREVRQVILDKLEEAQQEPVLIVKDGEDAATASSNSGIVHRNTPQPEETPAAPTTEPARVAKSHKRKKVAKTKRKK